VNRRVVIAFAAAASLAVPAAALAKTTAIRTGSFDAMGTGTLAAEGSLRVFGTIEGMMIVRDRVGGAVVKIGGVRQKPKVIFVGLRRVRVYTLRRINDTFYAKGDNIRVELRSPRATLSMSVLGRGRILRMDGEGTYHLNGSVADEQWSSALLPLAIKPTPPELPTPPAPGHATTATLSP
jgi:hypothetical protein